MEIPLHLPSRINLKTGMFSILYMFCRLGSNIRQDPSAGEEPKSSFTQQLGPMARMGCGVHTTVSQIILVASAHVSNKTTFHSFCLLHLLIQPYKHLFLKYGSTQPTSPIRIYDASHTGQPNTLLMSYSRYRDPEAPTDSTIYSIVHVIALGVLCQGLVLRCCGPIQTLVVSE